MQYDTLRFTFTLKADTDDLIWWESNLNVGLPKILYATDSAFFGLEDKYYGNPIFKIANKAKSQAPSFLLGSFVERLIFFSVSF